ncbi:hypothetical protein THIOKS11630004 [Thiocapsa sp. KS1]|nr:IS3 family transposase [Thiocapsa sp. KS1]CRI63922.1 hypothetical protein THIOKS11630004 [Thiocapsa sp. KS1]
MVDRKDPLPVTRQCALPDLPRSTFYHVPKPVSDEELERMALIDRCHLQHPFYGSRRIRDGLEDQGHRVNRKKVQRLMRTMDPAAQYPKRNPSLANQAHKVYPYLLRDLVINRPNQVWATDVTDIPMARGFVYPVAIMDRYSRKVLSWRVSNTLDASFCVQALEEAVAQSIGFGKQALFLGYAEPATGTFLQSRIGHHLIGIRHVSTPKAPRLLQIKPIGDCWTGC